MKPTLVKPLQLDAHLTDAAEIERGPRRARNILYIRILALGGINFLLFTLIYAALGGDAHNGGSRTVVAPDGTTRHAFYIAGHYIRDPNGEQKEVSRGVWAYSYIHSISVWITSAAMILSMLALARPHIVATMRDGRLTGPTFVVAFGTIVVVLASSVVFFFTWDFVNQLTAG